MEIHRFTTTFEQQRRRVRVAQIGVIEINTHRMRAFEMVSQATVLWSTQEGYLQTWEKQSRSYPSVLRLPVERTSWDARKIHSPRRDPFPGQAGVSLPTNQPNLAPVLPRTRKGK